MHVSLKSSLILSHFQEAAGVNRGHPQYEDSETKLLGRHISQKNQPGEGIGAEAAGQGLVLLVGDGLPGLHLHPARHHPHRRHLLRHRSKVQTARQKYGVYCPAQSTDDEKSFLFQDIHGCGALYSRGSLQPASSRPFRLPRHRADIHQGICKQVK